MSALDKLTACVGTWSGTSRLSDPSMNVSDDSPSTAQWIDSWHMGESVMSCHGTAGADGSLSVTGSYAAPPGRDWGWRIAVEPVDDSDLRLFMYNITPDGEEGLAVDADYRRD